MPCTAVASSGIGRDGRTSTVYRDSSRPSRSSWISARETISSPATSVPVVSQSKTAYPVGGGTSTRSRMCPGRPSRSARGTGAKRSSTSWTGIVRGCLWHRTTRRRAAPRRPTLSVRCGQPPAASAGGSSPRTGRPRASSGERRVERQRRPPAPGSRWRARSLRRPPPPGCRSQRAPSPRRPHRTAVIRPTGATASRTQRPPCSVGERASVSKPVRSKSSSTVVSRRRPRTRNRAAVSRSGAAGAARARRTASVRRAWERDRVHFVDVELWQRVVEGAHQSPAGTLEPVTSAVQPSRCIAASKATSDGAKSVRRTNARES